jgi:TPR repeat protein
MVGLFYQQGMGIPSDPHLAAYWYNKAAEQGMDNAQLLLGVMYAEGQGIPKDNKLAYVWLNLASTSSDVKIREAAIKMRDNVAKNMNPEDINAAKQLSQGYYNKMEVNSR